MVPNPRTMDSVDSVSTRTLELDKASERIHGSSQREESSKVGTRRLLHPDLDVQT